MEQRSTPKVFIWLTLTITIIVIALIGGSAVWLRSISADLAAASRSAQILRTAEGISAALIEDYLMHDYGAIETNLKRAFSNGELIELSLLNLEGGLISSVKRDPVSDAPVPSFDSAPLQIPKDFVRKTELVDDELKLWYPISAGTDVAWLYVVMQDNTAQLLSIIGFQTLRIAIVVSVIILLIFSFVLHRAYSLVMRAEQRLISENEQLGDQLSLDPLTGLLNRTGLQDRLIREVKHQRYTFVSGLAVCFLDMDGFKLINDKFGHPTGDEVLRIAARRIRSSIKSTDAASRFGGDEFVILLNNISKKEEIDAVLTRLRSLEHEPIEVNDQKIYVHFSIGVALYPQHAQNANELIEVADQAMYNAKQAKVGDWVYGGGNFDASPNL